MTFGKTFEPKQPKTSFPAPDSKVGFWTKYIFWAKVVQMQFLGPRFQVQEHFWAFIILMDLSYNSGENELLFVKIGAMVLDLQLDVFWVIVAKM